MTDYDMRCSEKSVREYVKSAMTGGGQFSKMLPLVICAALLTAMPIIGIIGYIITKSTAMLIIAVCAVIMAAGIAIFLHLLIKSTTDKLMEAYGKQAGLVCSVSDSGLIIVRDNRPQRVIGWDKITDMTEGESAFYLTESSDALMILDKSSVLSGSVQETSELIAKKLGERK